MPKYRRITEELLDQECQKALEAAFSTPPSDENRFAEKRVQIAKKPTRGSGVDRHV